MRKRVNYTYAGTKTQSKLEKLKHQYPNAVKIEDADIYWDDATGSLFVFTSEEWKEYLLGKREEPSEI